MTLNWDVPKTFDAFEELFNRVSQNDPDALNIAIENNLNENLGIDFVEDIIGNLSGRVVYMSYIIPPARLNSQTNLFGIQMLDIDAAKETIETMFEQDNFPELKEKKVRGVTIFQLPGPGARRRGWPSAASAEAERALCSLAPASLREASAARAQGK